MVKAASKKRSRAPSSSSEESEKEYQVEAVVDKRTRGKKVQYLLKWKGYDDSENTVSEKNRRNDEENFVSFPMSVGRCEQHELSGPDQRIRRKAKEQSEEKRNKNETSDRTTEETENGERRQSTRRESRDRN